MFKSKCEDGSVLVLSSIMMLALLIVAGFVLDGSRAYLQRRQMQVAADAAALAGTQRLSLNHGASVVGAEVLNVAATNGADQTVWDLVDDDTGIQVTARRTLDTYFVHLVGYSQLSVLAEAEAHFYPVSTASGLLPMTLPCSEVVNFVPGQTYEFWKNNDPETGNFGWLDWTGGANSSLELAQHISDLSASGERNIGEWVAGSPGVESSSAVRSALQNWIGQSVSIPLHDGTRAFGGKLEYRICGFARFTLTEFNFNGADKFVKGHFELFTSNGPAGSSTTDDFGVRMIKLTS